MTIKSFIFSLMIVTAVTLLLPSCNKGKKAATVSGMSKVMCDESFKNVLDDDGKQHYMDYLEWCAKEVYDNPMTPEDIW